MNGCGERTGNANLVSIIANLQLKLGFDCLSAEQLARLTETAHFVDEILNVTPDPNQPYVGRNAFAHKGGMHVAGVSADATTFEHVDPALVGNERELLVSELAGRASVLEKAAELGIELDDGRRRRGCSARDQGARAPRLPVRGGRRLARAAAAPRDAAATSRSSRSSPGA